VTGVEGGTIEQVGQSFGFRLLGLMKIVVSGFALIYMVMIGVYMVVFSENEERVKTQRKQIVYTLIGFLFLNIPGIVYQVMSPTDA
jgi:NADH:ubiquinone oxidoreductase subunit 6 (subunit J)